MHSASLNIKLIRATEKDAELIHQMQVESFHDLYVKYQDKETNPVNESIDKIIQKLRQPDSYFYLIKFENNFVGGVRIVVKVTTKEFLLSLFYPNIATKGSLKIRCLNLKKFRNR